MKSAMNSWLNSSDDIPCRASSISSGVMNGESVDGNRQRAQPSRSGASAYSELNQFKPFGVEMNIAQPRLTASVGRRMGHASGLAWAHSSKTSPSNVAPRSESGFSDDLAWIDPPPGNVTRHTGLPSDRTPGTAPASFKMIFQPRSVRSNVGATHQISLP